MARPDVLFTSKDNGGDGVATRDGKQIDPPELVRLMLDLIVLAFWTDTTRNVTFMFANDVSPRNFSFLDGVKENHHSYSHHENKEAKIEAYKKITRWHVEQFAYLLTRLKGIQEGERTLLDNSMIMCGSSLSDGNKHDPNNLPILLGGQRRRPHPDRPAHRVAEEHAAVQPVRLDAGLHGGSRAAVRRQHGAAAELVGLKRCVPHATSRTRGRC